MAIDTEKFKQLLTEEKKILEIDLSRVGRKNPNNPNDWETTPEKDVDLQFRDEIPDFLETMEEKEATEIELEQRLREVDLALKKISEGKYGVCEIGGEEIEEARLDANPAARTCKQHLKEDQTLPRP